MYILYERRAASAHATNFSQPLFIFLKQNKLLKLADKGAVAARRPPSTLTLNYMLTNTLVRF